jgi:hypothetical protein
MATLSSQTWMQNSDAAGGGARAIAYLTPECRQCYQRGSSCGVIANEMRLNHGGLVAKKPLMLYCGICWFMEQTADTTANSPVQSGTLYISAHNKRAADILKANARFLATRPCGQQWSILTGQMLLRLSLQSLPLECKHAGCSFAQNTTPKLL